MKQDQVGFEVDVPTRKQDSGWFEGPNFAWLRIQVGFEELCLAFEQAA